MTQLSSMFLTHGNHESAIKGELQELRAYADGELPDDIIVMVTNKKSQDQMREDLSLF